MRSFIVRLCRSINSIGFHVYSFIGPVKIHHIKLFMGIALLHLSFGGGLTHQAFCSCTHCHAQARIPRSR